MMVLTVHCGTRTNIHYFNVFVVLEVALAPRLQLQRSQQGDFRGRCVEECAERQSALAFTMTD